MSVFMLLKSFLFRNNHCRLTCSSLQPNECFPLSHPSSVLHIWKRTFVSQTAADLEDVCMLGLCVLVGGASCFSQVVFLRVQ